MKKSILVTVIAGLFFASAAQAAQPMIHVSVEGAQEQNIKVQVPISMLEAFRPAITDALGQASHGNQEIDFRELWQQIKAAGPNEFVNIQNGDGNISVSTTETHLVVNGDQGAEQFHVTVPLTLGDALFEGEQVDFDALMATLEQMQGQDLINVNSSDAQIRVWVQ